MTSSEERHAEAIGAGLREWGRRHAQEDLRPAKEAHVRAIIDAALAVADRKQAEKDATIAELRAEVERAQGAERAEAQKARWYKARVAELEAIVAEVRALADEAWEDGRHNPVFDTVDAEHLRAILDAPKGATESPCPTCSGPSRETVGMVCQTCGTDYAPKE